MVKLDAGVVLGLSALLVGLGSLIYARDQALAAREQVREAARQTDEMRRAQRYETSHALMLSTIEARQASLREWREEEWQQWDRPGSPLAPMIALVRGNHARVYIMRMYAEQLQEMYFGRKNDQVTDDHWRAMAGVMRGYFAPPLYRALFDEFAGLGWLTPEFIAFARDLRQTGIWKDPLGRLPDELPVRSPNPQPGDAGPAR